jgi:hypothetical protein
MYLVYRHWVAMEERDGWHPNCTMGTWLFESYDNALTKATEEVDYLLSKYTEIDGAEHNFVIDEYFNGFSSEQQCSTCLLYYNEQDNWKEWVEVVIERLEPR